MEARTFFAFDPAVAHQFAELKVGTALIQDVHVRAEDPALEAMKGEMIQQIRRSLQDRHVNELPRVQAFRRIYRQFGVNPGSRRPSAEALLRRILDPQKELYRVNTVVDIYNLFSAWFHLPMAAYDFNTIHLPVQLRFARDGELHQGIGQEQAEALSAGELIYADEQTVLCRDFNYRDAEATKVTLETKNLLLFVDGCAEVTLVDMQEALNTVAEKIVAWNGGSIATTWIFEAK